MDNLSDLVMPIAIGLIMFGIGLELCFDDFRRVFTHPKSVIVGLGCQLLLLPFLAFVLIYFWPMEPMYKIGIMVIAACPGGTSSNVVSKMLKGNVALAISLTAFNSFIILFTIPLIVEISFQVFATDGHAVDLEFWNTVKQVLFTVVLPVLAGILVSESVSPKTRKNFHKPLKFILPSILLLSFLFVIFLDDSGKDINYLQKLPLYIPLILLNVATMTAGFFTAKTLGLPHQTNFTIAIEIGLQNSVLAIFIGNQILESSEVSLIAILYSTFSFVSTFLVAYLLKKTKSEKK